MRVVIDTNVLVSGLISSTGPPAKIVNALQRGQLVAVMSEATFAELDAVLRRPHLQRYFSRARIAPATLLAALRLQADIVTPVSSTFPIRDERDRPFLELMATNPPPYCFITGDKDFEARQYGEVPVVSASVFVELLKNA